MTAAQLRVLGPQDWAGDGPLSGPDAAAARVLHRAFHERHLPLTPRLAVALARLQAAARPEADPDWGRGYARCRDVLNARVFGGTKYWRASLGVFPLVVVEPVLREVAGAVAAYDLHGAAALNPGRVGTGANETRIEDEVGRLLSTPEAMGPAFWITAGLRLHAEAEALHLARLTRGDETATPLIHLDVPVARLLFEVEPSFPEAATRRALPNRLLHPSALRRQGFRPKEGGVVGIRPSGMLEDLPDVLISELMLPVRMVANKIMNEGMLVRHRPPAREPRRDLLTLTFSDQREGFDGGATAKAAWADATVRLQILLNQIGRPNSDMVHVDIGALGLRVAAVSAEDLSSAVGFDPMTLSGNARTARLYDTGLLPGFVMRPERLVSGPAVPADLLADLGDLARVALRDAVWLPSRRDQGRVQKRKQRSERRRALSLADYERCVVLLLLSHNSPEGRAVLTDFSAVRAAMQARMRRLGAGPVALAAVVLPQTPSEGSCAQAVCDFTWLTDQALTVAEELPAQEALADWLGQISGWMIELTREVIGA